MPASTPTAISAWSCPGQPAQSVVLLQRKEIDAVSQWDTQYTLMGLAGMPMRMLPDPVIESFPANSFVATAESIKSKRDLLVRLTRAYTMAWFTP